MEMRREALNYDSAVLTAVIALLIISVPVLPASAGTGANSTASLMVFPDGWVDVTVSVKVSDSSPLAFRLDGEPHYLLVEGDGLLLNYTLDGRVVRVDPMGSSVVNISYQTPSLTSKVGAVWNLTVNLDVGLTKVYLPGDSRILGMSSIPQGIELRGKWIEVTFEGGDVWIAYRLGRIPTENTARAGSPSSEPGASAGSTQLPSQSRTTSSSPTGGKSMSKGTNEAGTANPQASEPGGGSTEGSSIVPYLLLTVLLASLTVLGAVKARSKKRHKEDDSGELDDELEERIISLLRERGGKEFQSVIIKEVDEPRATVWRRLRRMEREGKIRLRKEGRLTLVELTEPYIGREDL